MEHKIHVPNHQPDVMEDITQKIMNTPPKKPMKSRTIPMKHQFMVGS